MHKIGAPGPKIYEGKIFTHRTIIHGFSYVEVLVNHLEQEDKSQFC